MLIGLSEPVVPLTTAPPEVTIAVPVTLVGTLPFSTTVCPSRFNVPEPPAPPQFVQVPAEYAQDGHDGHTGGTICVFNK